MRHFIYATMLVASGCGEKATFQGNVQHATTAVTSAAGDPGSGAATAATLQAMTVKPGTATLGAGAEQQFTATGQFSDGSSSDITSSVTWSVDQADVVKLADSPGMATAQKVGKATVSAKKDNITATAAVTVTAAVLKSIEVTPVAASVGHPASVKAIGTYSDGSTADVTDQVTWTVADPSVATISTAPGAGDKLIPVTVGKSEVTATLGGVTGHAPVAVSTLIECSSPTPIVAAGKTAILTWSGKTEATYSVVDKDPKGPANAGSVVASGANNGLQATYTAPSSIPTAFDIEVVATPTDPKVAPASCLVRLMADGALGVTDDGKTPGLVGNVFPIPVGQQTMAAVMNAAWFTEMPIANILMPVLNVPNTPYQAGFPGYPNLTAWFAIRFDGRLDIPTPGAYTFRIMSDDGAAVYIDGQRVLINDGVHEVTTVTSSAVQLVAGMHTLRVDYFQGPPIYLALTLQWKGPNDAAFATIPPEAILRPAGK